MQAEGPTGDRAPRWRPWWAIMLALAGLVSLIYPGVIALMATIGVVGLVVAVLLLTFLVRGGRTPFWAGVVLPGAGWGWILAG